MLLNKLYENFSSNIESKLWVSQSIHILVQSSATTIATSTTTVPTIIIIITAITTDTAITFNN